jgi:hypothetical protein
MEIIVVNEPYYLAGFAILKEFPSHYPQTYSAGIADLTLKNHIRTKVHLMGEGRGCGGELHLNGEATACGGPWATSLVSPPTSRRSLLGSRQRSERLPVATPLASGRKSLQRRLLPDSVR